MLRRQTLRPRHDFIPLLTLELDHDQDRSSSMSTLSKSEPSDYEKKINNLNKKYYRENNKNKVLKDIISNIQEQNEKMASQLKVAHEIMQEKNILIEGS